MAKHSKPAPADVDSDNPVIWALNAAAIPRDPKRLAQDVEILDSGWNNTDEGRTATATGEVYPSGKHAK